MNKKPNGYQILNLEDLGSLTLGDTTTITDEEIVSACKGEKPILCEWIVDDVKQIAFLTKDGSTWYAQTETRFIRITVNSDNVEIVSDELA